MRKNLLNKMFLLLLSIPCSSMASASTNTVINVVNNSATDFGFVRFDPTYSQGQPMEQLVSFSPIVNSGSTSPVTISQVPFEGTGTMSAAVNYASTIDRMCKFSFTTIFNGEGDLVNLQCAASCKPELTCTISSRNTVVINAH